MSFRHSRKQNTMPCYLFQALAFRPRDTTSTPMTGEIQNREAACPQSLSLEARLTQMWDWAVTTGTGPQSVGKVLINCGPVPTAKLSFGPDLNLCVQWYISLPLVSWSCCNHPHWLHGRIPKLVLPSGSLGTTTQNGKGCVSPKENNCSTWGISASKKCVLTLWLVPSPFIWKVVSN